MFTYELADRLGMTVAELEATMSIEEFAGWAAFHRIKAQERN